ncbi:hypothetical protein QVD17_20898 [Tagetes erecta]|uniref:Toxin YqcG C-terminal domain-containing protein n=1 Tax=Tagetes erecta TaxID=13708 RepID=A0AAD8KMJ5_TARER|nr:hypothetical protein QVD17_20898 [Tagetes erecta]
MLRSRLSQTRPISVVKTNIENEIEGGSLVCNQTKKHEGRKGKYCIDHQRQSIYLSLTDSKLEDQMGMNDDEFDDNNNNNNNVKPSKDIGGEVTSSASQGNEKPYDVVSKKRPGSPSKDEGKPSVVSKKGKRDITSTGCKMKIIEDSSDEDEDTTSCGLKRKSDDDQADDGRIRYRCLCNGPHDEDDDVYDPRAIENFIRLINPPGCQRYMYIFDSDSDDAAAA